MRRLSALLLLLVFTGCTTLNLGMSFFRSTDGFVPLTNEGRVLLKPGAENYALQLQPYLNEAITTVEAAHYRKFPQPVKVYVCLNAERFSEISGYPPQVSAVVHPVHGLLLNRVIFTKPTAFIKGILTHELSHELLRQQLGWHYYAAIPPWFHEGFAEFITNGNLLEKVSVTDTKNLILSGRIIQAKDSGALLSYDITESFDDLPNPRYIFYRQGMMFVAWLKQRDETKFKLFLLSIQDGRNVP